MTITLQDLESHHREQVALYRIQTAVRLRIHAAIQPQLDALEELFHEYSPRKIGKHHPKYEGAQT